MPYEFSDKIKYEVAKLFTELALQNQLIVQHGDSADTAKEVVKFFDTVFDSIGKSTNVD